ncbi:thioredoxin [Halomicrobium zhouii]|uniref:Thioredoxin n=1 Tax=Halomicrobium zhouii TaxID=767519 RepID=A0A1I6M3W9_9EURY|nr:thioredoxin [Halomicrobium zhouii]SFS10353.1 thioredoxin [Halomicrobium zhouii]
MTEDDAIEEIRQQKIEELRDRTGGADGESTAESAPEEPVPVHGAAELNDVVGNHDVVLADFYADWCGPCQMLEPVVDSIAAETAATVVKVDVDANQRLASEYGVRGVPTLVLFADGEPAERLVGMQDEAQLRTTVENYA